MLTVKNANNKIKRDCIMSTAKKPAKSPEELFERYLAKNKENFDRQMGLSKKPGYDVKELSVCDGGQQ